MAKILVACEFSGAVRSAFAALGHDAWSCDLIPSELPGNHLIGDVMQYLDGGWDLMVAHPPCQYLSYAGNRWLTRPGRLQSREQALEFFLRLAAAPIPAIAIENPRGWPCQAYRKPDQVIEPFHFGHAATKATCLWLKNLPPLMASLIITNPVVNWTELVNRHDAKNRSRTFPGVAAAMAAQWGHIV